MACTGWEGCHSCKLACLIPASDATACKEWWLNSKLGSHDMHRLTGLTQVRAGVPCQVAGMQAVP